MNYQLTQGDSVVVTVVVTDDVTGAVVTPDAGSIGVSLSNSSDSFVLNTDGTITLTAGTTDVTGDTITVTATVGGVSSKAGVGTYDVVAAPAANPTTVTLSFGTETAPAATGGVLPAQVTLSNGTVLAAGSALPAGTHFTETGELLNADNTVYTGA